MRTSILMGLFACAIIFTVGSNQASAISLPETDTVISSLTIERMVDVRETSKSPLISLAQEKSIIENVPAVITDPVITKHVVADDENLSKIAEIHDTTWQRIYDKNSKLVDPNIIYVGLEITIPSKDELLETRVVDLPEPVIVKEESIKVNRTVSKQPQTPTASSPGNKYVAGYCTWYVKNRRPDLPNNLGNAITWVSRASAQGLATGSTPAVGAVGQQGNHVVYIESVNGDGTVTVSEMNQIGWNITSSRTVPASYFSYIY